MISKKRGFTLVELIVVITILAILWTISFLSLQWYSKNTRNSVRISDLWLLKKSLDLSFIKRSFFPMPDWSVNVTYSWATLWYQWYYWNSVFKFLDNLSKRSLEPLFDVDYTYSISKKSNQYQIWTMIEDKILSNITNHANALTNVGMTSYVSWNFDLFDIMWISWTNCFNITTPSIIINNLPSTWALLPWWNYNFVFNDSINIPSNIESNIDIVSTLNDFNISEVYNKCSINSLVDLTSYINNLSTAYQQYSFVPDFDQVVYYSDTVLFKLDSVDKLRKNWISVSESIIEDIYFAADYNVFMDTFIWNNNDELIWWHTPESWWNWSFMSGSTNTSYIINSNTLFKWDSSTNSIFPNPFPAIASPDTLSAFEIINFQWGSIYVYSRHIDSNNYYSLKLSANWYIITKMVWWLETQFSNIAESILPNSIIKFAIFWNKIKLLINDIEKENIIDNTFPDAWNTVLRITAPNASIDNYILLYK